MKIKGFIKDWKAGKLPVSTKSNNNLTLSEGYRAYWEMKKRMWENTEFKPLNDK